MHVFFIFVLNQCINCFCVNKKIVEMGHANFVYVITLCSDQCLFTDPFMREYLILDYIYSGYVQARY